MQTISKECYANEKVLSLFFSNFSTIDSVFQKINLGKGSKNLSKEKMI